jgi:hypothetical protein
MTKGEAEAILRMPAIYTHEMVRRAYAVDVKADHPDHGGAGTRLALLKEARDTLLCQREIPPCKLCKGSGKVRGRFGAQTCTACEGSGDQT